MMYRIPCPPSTPLITRHYQLLAAARLRIRRPDGTELLIGYGVGEIFAVLEPAVQYLVTCWDRLEEIPLADGSFIVDYPDTLLVQPVR